MSSYSGISQAAPIFEIINSEFEFVMVCFWLDGLKGSAFRVQGYSEPQNIRTPEPAGGE
jgi:hypothetical protein